MELGRRAGVVEAQELATQELTTRELATQELATGVATIAQQPRHRQLFLYRFGTRHDGDVHGYLLFSMSASRAHRRLHVALRAHSDRRLSRIVYHVLGRARERLVNGASATARDGIAARAAALRVAAFAPAPVVVCAFSLGADTHCSSSRMCCEYP
jgi:hypothetical protein